MSNLAKIIVEEYPKNNFAYQIAVKVANNSSGPPKQPPCFEHFSELLYCLNSTHDYSRCAKKYESFTECFKKFYM